MTTKITICIRYTLLLALLIAAAMNASADTIFTVNSTDDAIDTAPGDGFCATDTAICTLRAAIMEANALPGTDTITLPDGLYTLTLNGKNENQALTGDLDITSPIILNGASAKSTIIRGYDDVTLGDPVFDISGAAAVATISGVAIEHGTIGVKIGNIANVTIRESHIRENSGRGIKAEDSSTQVHVVSSAITHNSGGGVQVFSAVGSFENTTISSNIIPGDNGLGGGIHLYYSGAVTVNNSTIVDNYAYSGGGVYSHIASSYMGALRLSNSIVFNNRADMGNNIRGRIGSDGYNLVEKDIPGAGILEQTETDIVVYSVDIGSLADNGGETPTHALIHGSLAISGGSPAELGSSSIACAIEDQIGVSRMRYGCDMGAYQTNFAPYVRTISSNIAPYTGAITEDIQTDIPITQLLITFSEPMFDPNGNTEPTDVTNPANYALVMPGVDQTFQTEDCDVVSDNDAIVTLDAVTYDPALHTTTLDINSGHPLSPGAYRLLVCAALAGNDGQNLDGNGDQIIGYSAVRNFSIGEAQNGPIFVVNTLKDQFDGVCGQLHCSLREAVVAANTTPGANTIDLMSIPHGEFTLEIAGANEDNALTGDLDITGNLTIRGKARENGTTIDAKNLDRVFHVLGGHRLKLIDLAIVNGNAGTDNGGAILSSDAGNELILNAVSATLSKAANGGAIYSASDTTVKLTDSFLRGTATNNGGALYVVDTGLTLLHSAVQNASALRGGGVFITGETSQATISASSFTNNQATTAQGGGLYLENGQIRIVNSTVSSNTAVNGAGVYLSGGSATFNNLTIAQNTSQSISGAGIAGGIVQVGGNVAMSNSIVAQNVAKPNGTTTTTPADCAGQIVSTDYNLFTTLNGCTVTGATSHNRVVSDPLLNSLQAATNSPAYHSIKLGSPAIAAGNPATPGSSNDACEAKDILGTLRTDGLCDMGAYEENLFPTVLKTDVAGTAIPVPTLIENFHLDQGFTGMQATFGKPMYNPAGDSDPHDVTNLAHYRVVATGEDNDFQSDGCTFSGDDTVITPVSATYNAPLRRVDLTFASEINLPSYYRFVICDTVHDISGDLLDGDADGSGGGAFVRTFRIAPSQTGPEFTVNVTEDKVNGYCSITHCSLREAVSAANVYAGSASLKLVMSQYYVERPLILNNPTPGAVITINGLQPTRTKLRGTWEMRIFDVNTPVTLKYLELLDASGEDGMPGGAIYNQSANLVIEDSIVTNNSTNDADGGAIFNASGAGLTLQAVRIDYNRIHGTGNGVGVYNGEGATLNILDSAVTRNWLSEPQGNLTSDRSAITAHLTDAASFGLSTLSDFPDDPAGAGIFNAGGTVIIQRTAIHDNVGIQAGGLYNQAGTTTIRNSTLYTNFGFTGAGGLRAAGGTVILNNVTIGINDTGIAEFGAGIIAENGGVIQFGNTIIFGNQLSYYVDPEGPLGFGDCYNDGGTLQSLGYNLIGTMDNCELTGDTASNIVAQDPLFIANSTLPGNLPIYLELAENSPAIDAGNNATCETVDQRGIVRPVGSGCDIGAYEYKLASDLDRPAPTNLVTLGITETSVEIQWDYTRIDETAILIERSSDNGANWLQIKSVSANTRKHLDAGRVCETHYQYRVRTFRSTDNTFFAYSEPLAVETLLCSPSNLTAVFEVDHASLSWTDRSSTETSFHIERKVGASADWIELSTTAANQTAYNDADVVCNATYSYRIRIHRSNDGQYSAYSLLAALNTPLCAPADLELDMTVNDNAPGEGVPITYTLTLSNNGPNVAADVKVKVPLPAGLALVSQTPAQGSYEPTQNLWTVGAMPANASTSLVLTVRPRGATQGQTIPFEAEVLFSSAADPDSTPDNTIIGEDDLASTTILVGCAPQGTMNVASGDVIGLTVALAAARNETCYPGSDTITLSPDSIYTLKERFIDPLITNEGFTGLPLIVDTVVIEGNNAIIERDSGENTPYFRFFYVRPTGHLTVNNVTLRGAHIQGQNESDPVRNSGAAVYNRGNVTINHSLLTKNYSHVFGTIYNEDATILLNDVDVVENKGGNYGGEIIYNRSSSSTHPEQSLIVFKDGQIANNVAGRQLITNTYGELDISNSTLAHNRSNYYLKLLNNSYGKITLTHNTIFYTFTNSGQSSDAVIQTHYSKIRFFGNVIQNQTSSKVCNGIGETYFYSDGYNVISDNSCDLKAPSDQLNTSALLVPIVENGVDTGLYMPFYSSMALNLIPSAECRLTADQRGAPRPQGRGCDAGAIEIQPSVAGPDDLMLIAANTNAIEIGWTDNQNGEMDFSVERADFDLLNWTELAHLPANSTSYIDTTIECGTTYIYRVRVSFANGVVASSDVLQISTADCVYAAPQNLSATAQSQTAVALTWDDVTDENGYRIEWSADGLGMWTTLGIVGENIGAYADNTLTCGITRHYRIIALYEDTESAASPTASDMTENCEVIPTAPETLTATAQGQTVIVLNWDDVADESGYRVEWSPDGAAVEGWTTLTTVGADVIEYTDNTLNCETNRHYRIIAINGDAESEPSPTASATTENCEQPPTIKVVKNGSFEQRRPNNPQLPKSWVGTALRKDKVVCGSTVASAAPYDGQCAFRFTGQVNNLARLKQDIDGMAFTTGDILTLSAYVNRINVKAGGKLWLVVEYKGSTAPKRKTKTLALVAGSSGGYERIQLEPIIVARPVKFVRITLEYSGKSGKLLIDKVQLDVQKADELPIEMPLTPPDMRLSN